MQYHMYTSVQITIKEQNIYIGMKGLFGCSEVGGSEEVGSMILFFLENKNLCFFRCLDDSWKV